MDDDDVARQLRERMVANQIAARGITDVSVLDAMRRVPRHRYVPSASLDEAYDDRPLPIGHAATISQPFIVALMTQELRLRPSDRVLEIGTGSGYGAAVLGEIAAEVVTVERVESLARQAGERLADRDNVRVVSADGIDPGAVDGMFDAISVTAATPEVPGALLDRLAPGGRLVAPVGRGVERLTRITRTRDGDVHETITDVRFVPLRRGTAR